MRGLRLLLAVLCLLAVPPAAAGVRAIQAAAGDAALVTIDGKTRIEWADGTSRELPLPPGSRIDSIAELEAGWIATGYVFGANESELLVLRDTSGVVEELAAPSGREASLRRGTAPLVENGKLRGIAWLEGDSQRDLEVRAATWDGLGWGTPELVSPRGPGSQLALQAAVLTDGVWMLAWTAFDGEDDETVWSRRAAGGWSEPLRVHEDNSVPDTTPTLIADGRGALVAWSWYDGNDYRLRIARYDGAAWGEQAFPSGKGSHLASLIRLGGRLLLLHRSIVPDVWSVSELQPQGRPVRRAEVTAVGYDRPLLRAFLPRPHPPSLVWPGAEVERPVRSERPAWGSLP